jgi:GxxExxY protein
LSEDELAKVVLEASKEVIDELGWGFFESVYQKALLIALHQKGIEAKGQVPLKVKFRGYAVGEYYADILVDGKVVVEVKALRTLAPEHVAQVLNYLKATGMDCGLLLNFGRPQLDYKKLYRHLPAGRVSGNGMASVPQTGPLR